MFSRGSNKTYVTYWVLRWTEDKERGLHFPGSRWKSTLYNSLLPSRQIKGPLFKKMGVRARLREFKGGGATKKSFYYKEKHSMITTKTAMLLSVGANLYSEQSFNIVKQVFSSFSLLTLVHL